MKWFSYLAVLCLGSFHLSGCTSEIPQDERNNFAQLYAELLMTEAMYDGDSVRMKQAIDSLLQGSRFSSKADVREWLENITASNPDILKETLDSAQQYLERIRNSRDTAQKRRNTPSRQDSL